MRIDPAIGLLIVAGAALLFARAAVHKLRDLAQFEQILAAYRVLPAGTGAASRLLPLLELAVAAGLMVPASRLPASVAALLLLLIYALAIAINLLRGRRDISCGCGGPRDRTRIAPWMVARNVVIAVALALTLLPWGGRDLVFTDAVTLSFGLVTLALVHQCVEQLTVHLDRFQPGRPR
jgi:hypothetical protein